VIFIVENFQGVTAWMAWLAPVPESKGRWSRGEKGRGKSICGIRIFVFFLGAT
jgi:hypothetical protein